jgi:hypothetical protein
LWLSGLWHHSRVGGYQHPEDGSRSTKLQCPKPEGHNTYIHTSAFQNIHKCSLHWIWNMSQHTHNIVLFMRIWHYNNVWCSYDNMLLLLISYNQFFTNRNVLFDKSKDNTSDLFTTMYNNGISMVLFPLIALVQRTISYTARMAVNLTY